MFLTSDLLWEPTLYNLVSDWRPQGDQPKAIELLSRGLVEGQDRQVLLGVTGSGKTFTMAHVIQQSNRPALVMAPNKTLAAQLYNEFRELFPDNAVRYYVSYYDYYQPEAYVPRTDTYIAKDSAINDEIDKMRHSTTKALLDRRDVIVVASVSCIYGLGSPESYFDLIVFVEEDAEIDRDAFLRQLVNIQYVRKDYDFYRGTFRAKGDTVDIFPSYEDKYAIRIEFFGDTIERIIEIDPIRGKLLRRIDKVAFYPARHYATKADLLKRAITSIRTELGERLAELHKDSYALEAQRLEQRTLYDIALLEEMGVCPGIENYSRHLDGRSPGEPPFTLLSYFPKDYLLFIDESHVTVPQIGGMYRADVSRKQTLVDHGFRLPSAIDNRPLSFTEFEARMGQVTFVSATPSDYELRGSSAVVEQLVRPTGLLDPQILIRPANTQVEDLLDEIHQRAGRGERVLITTLTKRLAEDLTDYYLQIGIKVRYLHSDIDTLERIEIIRDLRSGSFDVLVGINLLREGLDIPEVALVAILDADKEGFLRSVTSLVQTIGRASRNINGTVIMYADVVTSSMRRAIDETERRREIQQQFNVDHGITPESIQKAVSAPLVRSYQETCGETAALDAGKHVLGEDETIEQLKRAMHKAAAALDFEEAAQVRDRIAAIGQRELGIHQPIPFR